MTLIGIDYSLTSPACCILKDNEYFFYAIQRKETKSIRKLNMLTNVIIEICPKDGLTEFQYADKISDMMLRWINSTIGPDPVFAMEDYAYGAKGNSLLDIVAATTIFRYKLIKKYGEEKFNLYSPSHIKKFATTKGNAKKDDMLFRFNRLKLKHQFGEWCHKMSKTSKPEEDCIDAFWTLQTMKSELTNGETENTLG